MLKIVVHASQSFGHHIFNLVSYGVLFATVHRLIHGWSTPLLVGVCLVGMFFMWLFSRR